MVILNSVISTIGRM